MRVGYLCMQSEFSTAPLEALLEAGVDVRFVMRPLERERRRDAVLERHKAPSAPDHTDARALAELSRVEPFVVAEREGIPRYLVGDASSEAARSLYRRERVDALVVAFFNQLLRPPAFEALPFGAINAHPSLLPEYRGPAPLFWTFHDARTTTGVSVHRVAAGEDDGQVFQRTSVNVPFGIRGEQLVSTLSKAAARGLVDVIASLEAGAALSEEQDHSRATRAPRPTTSELRVNPSWDARRVFAFVRGVGRWNRLVVEAGDVRLRAVDAESVDERQRVPGDWALVGDTLVLACREGSVTLRVKPLAHG